MSRVRSFLYDLIHEESLRRPVIVLAGLLVVTGIGERVLSIVFDDLGPGASDLPVWLPQFGTLGETVLLYTLFFDFLRFILIPLTLMWIAFAYGRHSALDSVN